MKMAGEQRSTVSEEFFDGIGVNRLTDLPRVGLVCDLLTEHWPSMDLVADSLLENLQSRYVANLQVQQLRPPWDKAATPRDAALHPSITMAERALNRIIRYSFWLSRKRNDFDLFHVIDHSYAHLVHRLPPERTVVTCHDVDAFRCLLEAPHTFRQRVWRSVTRRILSGLQSAAWIICDSGATADELVANGWARAERMSVVHLGVSPVFSPSPDPQADDAAGSLFKAHAEIKLLHVGSNIPRKRLDVLLRAFAEIKKEVPAAILVRVGGPLGPGLQSLAVELGVEHAIAELPYLSDRGLAAVYRKCNLLLLPSEREGFGLPVLEAMACGLPVLCSDIPALKEVGGEAASYAETGNVESFVSAALRLLQAQPVEIEQRRRNGLSQAGKFSWSRCVDETVKIYEKVLSAAPVKVRDLAVKLR
jgi:glycosyltransferase involved in cell wall biosynthesis